MTNVSILEYERLYQSHVPTNNTVIIRAKCHYKFDDLGAGCLDANHRENMIISTIETMKFIGSNVVMAYVGGDEVSFVLSDEDGSMAWMEYSENSLLSLVASSMSSNYTILMSEDMDELVLSYFLTTVFILPQTRVADYIRRQIYRNLSVTVRAAHQLYLYGQTESLMDMTQRLSEIGFELTEDDKYGTIINPVEKYFIRINPKPVIVDMSSFVDNIYRNRIVDSIKAATEQKLQSEVTDTIYENPF